MSSEHLSGGRASGLLTDPGQIACAARSRKRLRALIVAGAGVCTLLGGCGGERGEGPDSLPPGPHRAGAVEVRLGEVDGALTFGTIGELHRGPDGNLYLIEREEVGIRVITPGGEPVRRIGREGEGPGEFRFGPQVVAWAADSLLAWDATRLSWFGLDGTFLGSEAGPAGGAADPVPGLTPLFVFPDGAWIGEAPAGTGTGTGTGPGDALVLGVGPEGNVLDTLLVRDRTSARARMILSWMDCARNVNQPWPVGATYHPIAERGGIAGLEFELDPDPRVVVTGRTLRGDTLFRSSIPHRAVPIDPAEVETRIEQSVQGFRRACPGVPAGTAERIVRGAMSVPAQHRPLTASRSTADGGVWLRFLPEALGHPGPPDGEAASSWWVVLDPDGAIGGTVELPPRFMPHMIEDPVVWGVLRDELGVNYVARVRLGPA